VVGNQGFWPRVTTALAKHAAGQVALENFLPVLYITTRRSNSRSV